MPTYEINSKCFKCGWSRTTYIESETGAVVSYPPSCPNCQARISFPQVTEILKMPTPTPSVEETIKVRDARYGGFANICDLTQRFKSLAMQAPSNPLGAVPSEALDMIFHKIARILCGDPTYVDNWHDIAGYATLVEKHLLPSQSDGTEKE